MEYKLEKKKTTNKVIELINDLQVDLLDFNFHQKEWFTEKKKSEILEKLSICQKYMKSNIKYQHAIENSKIFWETIALNSCENMQLYHVMLKNLMEIVKN